MIIMFYQEESPNPSKRFKCLPSSLKNAFTKCHYFRGKLSDSSLEPEELASNFDEEDEVFVSAVMSKYMESKSKRKSKIAMDSFIWALSPEVMQIRLGNNNDEENREKEFYSAGSRLSRCSSATSFEAFVSVKTRFSRSSSLSRIDFRDFEKRSVIMEFMNCEGWPFGLCRKALLLPPLPKSPCDSWSWKKSGRMVNMGAGLSVVPKYQTYDTEF